jgi:hypothetical protein
MNNARRCVASRTHENLIVAPRYHFHRAGEPDTARHAALAVAACYPCKLKLWGGRYET